MSPAPTRFDQPPRWVGGLGRDELRAAMKNHIRQVMGHFAGRVGVWDVVNEAILDDGGLRPSPFLDKLGPRCIEEAFEVVRAADPQAKLFNNEIGAAAAPGDRGEAARAGRRLQADRRRLPGGGGV